MSWPLDPTVYAGLVALFLGHAWLARRVDDAQPKHTFYFGLGVLTLWVALETPIDTLSDHHPDRVHILQPFLLGFIPPPLLLRALSPTLPALSVHVPRLISAVTPMIDQTLACAVLMILGKASLAVAALSVFFRWFGGEHADDRTRVRWGLR